MRVLTWNLWWRHGPWQRRREAITATLAELAPDVCGLQEVWDDRTGNFAGELADRLGFHWCWAGRPPPESWQREHGTEVRWGNAVLSRWPITGQAELSLPVADRAQRLALHAQVATPAGVLPFFTTHLSIGTSAGRVAQVREVAGFVAAHANPDHAYPPVLTGDLNAEPDTDEVRLLGGYLTEPVVPGQVLVDAWRYADRGQPDQPGATWDHRNPYLAGNPEPDARIDYVLVGMPRAGRGRVRSARLAGNAPVAGVWPSDHFAVVAELDDSGGRNGGA